MAMKTLHINTERSWRGGEQQTLYLTAELHARGFDTALVCRPGVELEERARADAAASAATPEARDRTFLAFRDRLLRKLLDLPRLELDG